MSRHKRPRSESGEDDLSQKLSRNDTIDFSQNDPIYTGEELGIFGPVGSPLPTKRRPLSASEMLLSKVPLDERIPSSEKMGVELPEEYSQLYAEEHIGNPRGSTDENAVIDDYTEIDGYAGDDSSSGVSGSSGSSFAPSSVVTQVASMASAKIAEVNDNAEYEKLFHLVQAASSTLELKENICGGVEVIRGARAVVADAATATASYVADVAIQTASPYVTCVGNFLALARLATKSLPTMASKAAKLASTASNAIAKVPDVINILEKKGIKLMETMQVQAELLKLDIDTPGYQNVQATFILRELTMISRFTDLLLAMLNQKLIEHNTEDITYDILKELGDDTIIFSVFQIIQTVFLLHRGPERATELDIQPKTLRYRMNMIIEVLLLSQNNPLPRMSTISNLDYDGIVSLLPKIDFLEELVLPSSFAYSLGIHHMTESYIINLKHALVLIEYNKLVSGRYAEDAAREAQTNAAESDAARQFRTDLATFMETFNTTRGAVDQAFIDIQLQRLAGLSADAPRTARNKLPAKPRTIRQITVGELALRINDVYKHGNEGEPELQVITPDALMRFGAAPGDARITEETPITDENLLRIVSRLTNSTIFREEISERGIRSRVVAFTTEFAPGRSEAIMYEPGRDIMNFGVIVRYLGVRGGDVSRSTQLFLEARILEIVGPQRLSCSPQHDINAAMQQDARRSQVPIISPQGPSGSMWNKPKGFFDAGKKSYKKQKKQQKKQTRKAGGKRSTRKLQKKNHKKRSGHTKKQ